MCILWEPISKNSLDVVFYAEALSPFGKCLLGVSPRGALCHLSFFRSASEKEAQLYDVQNRWMNATLKESLLETQSWISGLFEESFFATPRRIEFFCSALQKEVWAAMLDIPRGSVTYYEALAKRTSSPKAIRAVARCVGQNPMAYVIPCHRVISKSGHVHRYRWGADIKRALLVSEGALHSEKR